MLFLAAAVLAGCASVRLKQPEVSLSGVDIKEFGLFEQRLGLALRVVNPNATDLAIDGVEFEVEVNGQGFARGVSNKATTVPRLGEAIEPAHDHQPTPWWRDVTKRSRRARAAPHADETVTLPDNVTWPLD